ncbi:hypothetical protein NPIL_349581 [Nephila pilipes]|uniref:Uncharacterized protein n=1 Tax=Nephila pilipes TaxID=299642 RepID=A0A8X6U306_NEPPI|nr:hypothetical protein NPIL_349581 [Nephila pilipes]
MNILAQKSIRTPLSHWSKLDLVKAGMSRDGRNLNELKEDRTSRIRGNQNELKATRTRRAGENWIIALPEVRLLPLNEMDSFLGIDLLFCRVTKNVYVLKLI